MKLKPYQCQLFLDFSPCFGCGKDCNKCDYSFYCGICNRLFCRKCLKLTINQSAEHEKSKKILSCNTRCEMSLFPFLNVENIDFSSALTGEIFQPCKFCKRTCSDAIEGFKGVQCDACAKWYHIECSNDKYAPNFISNDLIDICSNKCFMHYLPFCKGKYNNLVSDGVFIEHTSLNIISSPIKKVSQPHIPSTDKFV